MEIGVKTSPILIFFLSAVLRTHQLSVREIWFCACHRIIFLLHLIQHNERDRIGKLYVIAIHTLNLYTSKLEAFLTHVIIGVSFRFIFCNVHTQKKRFLQTFAKQPYLYLYIAHHSIISYLVVSVFCPCACYGRMEWKQFHSFIQFSFVILIPCG